MAPESKK